ncbi:MAG: tetratricopeptide repeat protein [Candidatus Krumholzibacteria bacterium]|nr:tetratricopeptide repeat protein [Candidatus Krumholzibacteria bacterium]
MKTDLKTSLFARRLFLISSVGALLLRLAYLLQVRGTTLFEAPLRDSVFYVNRAREILSGNWIGESVSFHSAPLYPYFMALFMGLGAPEGLWWLRLGQALLSALTVGLLSLTALRLFGKWSAIACAVLATFYAPFLFYAGEILEITLSLFFLSLAFWILAREEVKGRSLFLSGLFLGLAALGKPNLLVLGPVLWIHLGLFRKPLKPSTWAWRKGVLLTAGFLVAILPFTLRNRLAGDDWVLISSNGGINLFIGNNPQASGGFVVPANMQSDLEGSSRLVAEQARKRELKPSEVSRFWAERARVFFRTRPAEAARLFGRKALLLLNYYEIPNHYNFYFFRENYSSLLRAPLAGYSLILPLSLLGLLFGLRRSTEARRAGWSLLAVVLSVVLFFVTSRYRLPLLIWLLPFAGLGVAGLVRILLEKRWKPLVPALLILLLASALSHLPLVPNQDFHDEFLLLGNYWFQQEDFQRAAFYSTEALREKLDSAPAWQNLGYAYLRIGDYDRAEECLWKAAELNPNLGVAYGNLAKIYLDTGRPLLARQCYEKALRLDPLLKERIGELEKFLIVEEKGFAKQSRLLKVKLEKAREADPSDPRILVDLMNTLGVRMGDFAAARATHEQLQAFGLPDTSEVLRRATNLLRVIDRIDRYDHLLE